MAFSNRSTPPAFQFYASDFLGSSKVGRMSSAEIGIYTLLLCHAWTAEGLPLALPEIARLARVSRRRLELIWPGVLSECFVERRGRFVNPRQEQIRADLLAFRRKQAANGNLGGRPSKANCNPNETQIEPNGKAKSNPKITSPLSSLQSPSPKEQEQKISSEPSNGSEPPVLTFPTVGTPPLWFLGELQLAEWQRLYTNLSVRAEMNHALAWVQATPAKRKTAKGMPRFLVNWLNRAADNGNGHSPTRAPAARQAAQEPSFEPWTCPHLEDHSSRWRCEQATQLNRPRKADAS